jgi:CRP-like cAMP-binding protein
VLNEGDYFGEMAIVSGDTRRATVRTTVPTELYSLAQRNFVSLLDREADVARAVSETIDRRRAALEAASASVAE